MSIHSIIQSMKETLNHQQRLQSSHQLALYLPRNLISERSMKNIFRLSFTDARTFKKTGIHAWSTCPKSI